MGLKDAVRVGAVRGLTVQRGAVPCVAKRIRHSCHCNSHVLGGVHNRTIGEPP